MRAGGRWTIGCVMVLSALAAPVAMAEDIEKRLEKLERKVEMILEILAKDGLVNEAPDRHAADPQASETVVNTYRGVVRASQALGTREVAVAYYLSTTSLDVKGPPEGEPSSSGKIDFNDVISFDPAHYDISSGFFSEYRDPARYSDVGVLLTATIRIDEEGVYEFVFQPKPARTGGSAVGTSMAMRLRVDDQWLLESNLSKSWKPVRIMTTLRKGLHTIKLWIVAQSPGYGPSPTASRLIVSLKGEGDASPRPLPLVVTER